MDVNKNIPDEFDNEPDITESSDTAFDSYTDIDCYADFDCNESPLQNYEESEGSKQFDEPEYQKRGRFSFLKEAPEPFYCLDDNKNIKYNSKLKSFFFNNRFIFLAAGISAAVLLIVFIVHGIFPIGNKTVLRIDLYHQYAPFFQELYKKLTTGDTIVYSLFSGLGNNFLCNFFNYLCSPFSFLILLFGENYITEAIACMIFIKCTLSSASFCYYLKKSQNHYGYYSAAFSVLYSLCAYFTAYYWNVMWMDAMYLFPLVMLGLESIVKYGKWKLYIFSLAAMIITGYYIAFMVCIFSVLYFIITFINNHKVFSLNGIKKLFSRSFVFGLASIGAAGLACFMLIPMFFGLTTSSATNGSFPTTIKTYFNLFEFLSSLLPGVEPTIRSSADLVTPNIFCGTIVLILLPLYYMSSKIKLREKITHTVLLIIMYFSFNLNILNYIWHGFHYPNDLPYRQSFLFSFLLLIMCYKALVNIREHKRYRLIISCSIAGIFAIVSIVLWQANFNIGTAVFAVIAVAAFSVLPGMIISPDFSRRYSASFCLILVFLEMTVQSSCYWQCNQSKDSYYANYDKIRSTYDNFVEENNGEFFRLESTNNKTRNDPSLFQYNGLSGFSSLAYESTSKTLRRLGMFGNNINSYTYYPSTPVINSLFSIKYFVGTKKLSDDMYSHVSSDGTFRVYENKYHLPLLIEAGEGFDKDNIYVKSIDPFENQTDLIYNLSQNENAKNIFKKRQFDNVECFDCEITSSEGMNESGNYFYSPSGATKDSKIKFTINVENSEHLFIYASSSDIENVDVLYNSSVSESYDVAKPYILDLGIQEAGTTVDITLNLDSVDGSSFYLFAYTLDMSAFESVYNSLNSGTVSVTTDGSSIINAKINAEKSGEYFVSIPYDEAWTITVDGENVQVDSICDSFISFKVSKGEHTVTMKYEPRGVKEGLIVTCASAVLIAPFLAVSSYRKRRNSARIESEE